MELQRHRVNLHRAPFPCAVDNHRLLFDNRIHRKSILVRFFLGPVARQVELTCHLCEQVERQIAHLTMRQQLRHAYLLDVVTFVPSLKINFKCNSNSYSISFKYLFNYLSLNQHSPVYSLTIYEWMAQERQNPFINYSIQI